MGYPFVDREVLTNENLNAAVQNPHVLATGSTTRRYMADRLSEVRNVLDFGAAGDGSTDDTAAIQAAATAIPTQGGILLFPGGLVYKRTAEVVLKARTAVRGYGAKIKGPGGLIPGDWVFFNPNSVTYADIDEQTTDAIRSDDWISIEGLTVSEVALAHFLLGRHIRVAECFGDYSNAVPNSFVHIRGCDSWIVENNVVNLGSAGVDTWQGNTRGIIRNNVIRIFVNSSGLGNKYGIGINGLGSNEAGNLRNVPQLTDDILVEGNTIEVNGTAAGIQFDTLAVGCTVRNVKVLNNTIIGQSGTNNYGIYARGDIQDSVIDNNKVTGCNPPGGVAPIHLGGYFGTLVTGTDTITTTSGSDEVVVKYPNHYSAVGGWVRLNADPSGPTAAVGGLTFDGYYEILAVSAGAATDANATVTIQAAANASASATGGGATEIVSYFGQPARCKVRNNILRNCGNASGALINANGTGHHLTNNDMTDCDPAAYDALTYTDQYDAPAATTQWAAVVIGNTGAPGTGISGANNSTRNAYIRSPLIIEPRTETSTSSWWIKGPIEFADAITLAHEAIDWTPVFTFGGLSTGITFTTLEATYTVWANMCWVEINAAFSSKGSATGDMLISLPFPDATGLVPAVLQAYGWANAPSVTSMPLLRVSSQSIVPYQAGTGGARLTDANCGNNLSVQIAGLYRIN